MNSKWEELRSTSVLFVLILVGFALSESIDISTSADLATFTGPRAYPQFILGTMLLLVCILFGQIAIRKIRDNSSIEGGSGAVKADFNSEPLIKIGAALVLLSIFTTLFEPLGYLLTMVPLMVLISILNGSKKHGQSLAFAIIAAAICLIIFRYGLDTVLPEGLLGIDQIF